MRRLVVGVVLVVLAGSLFVSVAIARPSPSPSPSPSSWASGVRAGLPANAAANPAVDLEAVSCASAGNCTAVGSYADSSARYQGLMLTVSAGKWSSGVEAALPAGAAANPEVVLLAVSCASAGNCTAVGHYNDSSGNTQGLLLTESSGRWSAGVEATVPGASTDVFVYSVSCVSAGDCIAVGSYSNSSGSEQEGLVLTESSGTWSRGMPASPPADALSSHQIDLLSVSCASAGNCTAVGRYPDSAAYQGLLLNESAGRWSTGVKAALPAGAAANPEVVLNAVSCASAGSCSAIGSYNDGMADAQGLLLTESAGRWSAGTQAALPAGAGATPTVSLAGVSCGAADNCAAVGYYADGPFGIAHGLLLSESSARWSAGLAATLPANAASNRSSTLSSVSCVSAGDCTAVGSYQDSSSASQGLLVTESSGTWATGVEAKLPAAGEFGSPDSVSCAAAGSCSAVGTFHYTRSSGSEGLMLTESLKPKLSTLRASPGRVVLAGRKVGRRCVLETGKNKRNSPCRRPVKLTISYSLNETATVSFSLARRLPGRYINRRCVKPTDTNRQHRHCVRLNHIPGRLEQSDSSGAHHLTFTGVVARHPLAPGSYQLTATPSAAGHAGSPITIHFTLVS